MAEAAAAAASLTGKTKIAARERTMVVGGRLTQKLMNAGAFYFWRRPLTGRFTAQNVYLRRLKIGQDIDEAYDELMTT